LFARSTTGPRFTFSGQLPEVIRPALRDAGPALATEHGGGVEPRLSDQIFRAAKLKRSFSLPGIFKEIAGYYERLTKFQRFQPNLICYYSRQKGNP
jgi:hypothetical protein